MKEIFMQRTIDYMASIDPSMLNDLGVKGIPELIELTDDKGETINKYYKYTYQDDKEESI